MLKNIFGVVAGVSLFIMIVNAIYYRITNRDPLDCFIINAVLFVVVAILAIVVIIASELKGLFV